MGAISREEKQALAQVNALVPVPRDDAGPHKVDLDTARVFLDILDPTRRPYTFQTLDDSKARKDPQLARVFHGDFNTIAQDLIELNRQGAGVFVMINVGDGIKRRGAGTCRTAKNVVGVRAFFADLDGSPLEPVFEDGPNPTIVIESSPNRWHVYWALSNATLNSFKDGQQLIATKYKGDLNVHDLPRVMRLPGFFHQKATPFQSRIIYMGWKC